MNRSPAKPSIAWSPKSCGFTNRTVSNGRGGDATGARLRCKFLLVGLVVAGLLELLAISPALALNEFAKLVPSDGEAYDYFGRSVGISGNTAIVGASYGFNNNKPGIAYLFDASTGAQLNKLTASDGMAGDQFGHSVAIDGKTAIVGAWRDDDNGTDSGSAYLFDVATGAQLAKLTPSDAAENDYFGVSVSISGNTAIVGAVNPDSLVIDSGSAYLFDVTTGAQLAKLSPSDGAPGDKFGQSVSISGNVVIVGAWGDDDNGNNSGSAYLFDITTGSQLAKLTPSDGAEDDRFGYSVAIDGGAAIVGASLDDAIVSASGSAFLFDATTGVQLGKLTPSDREESFLFGAFVAIDVNTAVASGNFVNGLPFVFDSTTGAELAKLESSDGDIRGYEFGTSVGISGNTVVVGGVGLDSNGDAAGSAYLFDVSIPEPSTLLMAAWVSVGVLACRRR